MYHPRRLKIRETELPGVLIIEPRVFEDARGLFYEIYNAATYREHGLPDPVWNVDLRLPGGPHLGGLDAFWQEHSVAVELDTRAPRQGDRNDDDSQWSEYARKR